MNELPESAPPPAPEPRPLSRWEWVIAVLLFPPGVFVVFARARLLSWPRGIALALVSYFSISAFTRLMAYLEETDATGVSRSLALMGGTLMLTFWGYTQYHLGQRIDYWSPAAQRGWRRAGWLAVVVFLLGALGLILQLFGIEPES